MWSQLKLKFAAIGHTHGAMTGADGTNAGTAGFVPAPAAADNVKFLRGDGTWQTVAASGSPTVAVLNLDFTDIQFALNSTTNKYEATLVDPRITSYMAVSELVMENPVAIKDGVSITTSAGSLTFAMPSAPSADFTGTIQLILDGAGSAVIATPDLSIFNALLLAAHPVGSYYWSDDSTDPGTLFGGTWSSVTDTFILAAGSTYTAGDTGGEAEHTLTTSELPEHSHTVNQQYLHRLDTADTNYVNYAASGSLGGWDLPTTTNNAGATRLGIPEFSTNDTGSNTPHNNMPPYVVAYCWKRIS